MGNQGKWPYVEKNSEGFTKLGTEGADVETLTASMGMGIGMGCPVSPSPADYGVWGAS